MGNRVNEIKTILEKIPNIEIIKPFEQDELMIVGEISAFVEGLEHSLNFKVSIDPQYPFKSHGSETIKFLNEELLEYKHIMTDGSICIHTAHSPILSKKLNYDIESVKEWIIKYYINKDSDSHYEHLIVPEKAFKGSHFAFFFNEVEYVFSKNQYGFVEYSKLSNGVLYNEIINSNIIQKFYDKNKKLLTDVNWNFKLKSLPSNLGLFIFLGNAPSKNQRWAYNSWNEFVTIFQQDFLQFLFTVQNNYNIKNETNIPLFIGYNINETEIHWQVIMMEIGVFPIYGEKINKKWITMIDGSRSIDWAITRNCSINYFYGRGRLNQKITNGKILIIGIGAIGSIVAKTLVRCGCIKVDFVDYDIKEPENVCRSEYSFITGITNKTNDLINELCIISPFIETKNDGHVISIAFNFLLKSNLTDISTKKNIEKFLNDYDLIFDCSTDNDLLFAMSSLNLNSILLNLSISNHAKHLVCATEHNRYDFITTQFDENVLNFNIEDLYNPTGCWNPTFKASYNDINTLVQFAIKHINIKIEKEKPLRNFVIETDDTDCLTINIKEF